MNGQNTPVADSASVQAASAPLAAPATQAQVASQPADSVVVYKIVNGDRAGEEVVLAPACARKDSCMQAMMQATPASCPSNTVKFNFEASGLVVVLLVVALLAFLGFALSVVRSIALGSSSCKPCGDASASHAAVAAPAASAAHAPVAVAPASAQNIHPGLTNEQLAVILAVAAAEALGPNVNVVKVRPMNAADWTWAAQGRNELHSNRLV